MSEPRFQIAPEIVHEEVDGEVIAIDLGSGSYFSVAGSGPAIWALLCQGQGVSEEEIGIALAARFEAGRDEIAAAVSVLLAQLRESGLIVSVSGEGPGVAPEVPGSGKRAPFEAPRLEHYDDMKDYFLLDPIHEVDSAGWPRPAA